MNRKNVKKSASRRPRPTGRGSSYMLQSESKTVGRRLFSNLGLPDRSRVRLAYAQRFTLAASTVASAQIMRGGSCFDPDYSGGGNQPSQYDLFAAAYFRYRVWGSSIEVSATATNSGTPVRLGLIPTNNTTTVIDIPDLLTNSRAQHKIVGIATGGGVVLSDSQRSDTIMGSAGLIQDTHTALVTSSPTDDWYWHITAASFDSSTSTTVYIDVRMVYDVEFFDKALQDTDLVSRVLRLRQLWLDRPRSESKDTKPQEQKSAKPTAATAAVRAEEPEYELVSFTKPVQLPRKGAGA